MPRTWGPWTEIKLDALEKYMSAFTTASARARGTLYLDLFGGRPENRGRGRAAGEDDDSDIFAGSALRAALVTPPFTQLIVSELNTRAAAEQRARLAEVAGDRALVVQGDCNVVMPEQLRLLAARDSGWRFAPTFALVDQFSAEVTWRTLHALATFKHKQARSKVELCLYVGPSFMLRGLRGAGGTVNVGYAERLDAMFGTQLWRYIQAALDDDVISWGQAEAELVNLMRWRLEDELGYETTIPLQLKNTVGRDLFTMIFATDHPVGSKIMGSLFGGAEGAVEEMVRIARLERKIKRDHQESLFGSDQLAAMMPGPSGEAIPTLGPPRPPYTYDRLWDRDQ